MTDYHLMERLRAKVTPWRAGHHMPGSIGDIQLAIDRIEELERRVKELEADRLDLLNGTGRMAKRITALMTALREIVDMPLSAHDAYLSAVSIARRALEDK